PSPERAVDNQVGEQVLDREEALRSDGGPAYGAVMRFFPAGEGVVGEDAVQPVLKIVDRVAVALVQHVSAQQVAGIRRAEQRPPEIEAIVAGQERKKG